MTLKIKTELEIWGNRLGNEPLRLHPNKKWVSLKSLEAERCGRVAELKKAITILKSTLPNYDFMYCFFRLDKATKRDCKVADVVGLLRAVVEKDEGKT